MVADTPDFCSVAVTWKCPSACATCGIWNAPLSKEEMTLEEYARVLQDPLVQKTKVWEITGGEPLMYKDIFGLLDLCFETLPKSVQIRIGTNCILDERLMELLDTFKKYPLYLSLSLDGLGDLHDKIRGSQGNFKKVAGIMDHLKILQSMGSPIVFGASICVSRLNVDHVPELTAWLGKRKVPYQLTPVVFPPYAQNKYARVDQKELDFLNRKDREKAIDLFSKYGKETYKIFLKYWSGQFYKKAPCYALLKYIHFRPNGDVESCMWKPVNIGNLKYQSFTQIWKARRTAAFRKNIHSCKECSSIHPNMCDALNNYYFHGYLYLDGLKLQIKNNVERISNKLLA
jgi:MoaA/NifB/PqqE/SkfB family radical SAM enzyme